MDSRFVQQLPSAFQAPFVHGLKSDQATRGQTVAWLLAWALLPLLTLDSEGQYAYTTNDGTVTITQYVGPGGAVDIPASIAGLPVSSIADFAFYSSTNLASIGIPEGVTNVGFEAFYACASLTNISLPSSVTGIGNWAFQNCPNLASITVNPLNAAFSSVAGVLFNGSQTSLLACPGGKSGRYAIPASITNIGVGAFGGCARLSNVTIPAGVTNIDASAFYSCAGLASVLIPDSVTNIGNSAFYSCTSLRSVQVGNGVTQIGDYAFASCNSLGQLILGSRVVSIGYGAFSDSGLTNLTLPDSVSTLGDAAFEYCSNLASVVVGQGLSAIPNFAFDACTALSSVRMNDGQSSIGVDAFGRCANLTSITIPQNVTKIGDAAFVDCASLGAIYFGGNAPAVGGSLFSGDTNGTVYYLPERTGWGSNFAGLPSVLWDPQIQTRDAGLGIGMNGFGFSITTGSSNLAVVVEACTNLSLPVWSALQTNQLASGAVHFFDSTWTNSPQRFYRLRSP